MVFQPRVRVVFGRSGSDFLLLIQRQRNGRTCTEVVNAGNLPTAVMEHVKYCQNNGTNIRCIDFLSSFQFYIQALFPDGHVEHWYGNKERMGAASLEIARQLRQTDQFQVCLGRGPSNQNDPSFVVELGSQYITHNVHHDIACRLEQGAVGCIRLLSDGGVIVISSEAFDECTFWGVTDPVLKEELQRRDLDDTIQEVAVAQDGSWLVVRQASIRVSETPPVSHELQIALLAFFAAEQEYDQESTANVARALSMIDAEHEVGSFPPESVASETMSRLVQLEDLGIEVEANPIRQESKGQHTVSDDDMRHGTLLAPLQTSNVQVSVPDVRSLVDNESESDFEQDTPVSTENGMQWAMHDTSIAQSASLRSRKSGQSLQVRTTCNTKKGRMDRNNPGASIQSLLGSFHDESSVSLLSSQTDPYAAPKKRPGTLESNNTSAFPQHGSDFRGPYHKAVPSQLHQPILRRTMDDFGDTCSLPSQVSAHRGYESNSVASLPVPHTSSKPSRSLRSRKCKPALARALPNTQPATRCVHLIVDSWDQLIQAGPSEPSPRQRAHPVGTTRIGPPTPGSHFAIMENQSHLDRPANCKPVPTWTQANIVSTCPIVQKEIDAILQLAENTVDFCDHVVSTVEQIDVFRVPYGPKGYLRIRKRVMELIVFVNQLATGTKGAEHLQLFLGPLMVARVCLERLDTTFRALTLPQNHWTPSVLEFIQATNPVAEFQKAEDDLDTALQALGALDLRCRSPPMVARGHGLTWEPAEPLSSTRAPDSAFTKASVLMGSKESREGERHVTDQDQESVRSCRPTPDIDEGMDMSTQSDRKISSNPSPLERSHEERTSILENDTESSSWLVLEEEENDQNSDQKTSQGNTNGIASVDQAFLPPDRDFYQEVSEASATDPGGIQGARKMLKQSHSTKTDIEASVGHVNETDTLPTEPETEHSESLSLPSRVQYQDFSQDEPSAMESPSLELTRSKSSHSLRSSLSSPGSPRRRIQRNVSFHSADLNRLQKVDVDNMSEVQKDSYSRILGGDRKKKQTEEPKDYDAARQARFKAYLDQLGGARMERRHRESRHSLPRGLRRRLVRSLSARTLRTLVFDVDDNDSDF